MKCVQTSFGIRVTSTGANKTLWPSFYAIGLVLHVVSGQEVIMNNTADWHLKQIFL